MDFSILPHSCAVIRQKKERKGEVPVNMVVLVGRLTRDPSYNEVQGENGSHHIVSFYLAVPRNYGREVNYIKITAF